MTYGKPRAGTTARRLAAAVLCLALVPMLAVVTGAAPASAALLEPNPGNPGVPQDPGLIFDEDFEQTGLTGPESILDYVGTDGTTYTAEPPWDDMVDCNGTILEYTTETTPCPNTDQDGFARNNIRRLADVLGQVGAGVQGGTDANPVNGSTDETRANRAVAEFTQAIDPAPNSVVLHSDTTTVRTLDEARFLTFSVDVAELSCDWLDGQNRSRLDFFLLYSGVEHPTQTSPIMACTDERTTSYASPPLEGGWGNGGEYVRAGTFVADASQLVPADTEVEFLLRNQTGSASGNDYAIDNVRLLDVTPQLDKSFSPTSVPTGGTSTLTFTVTNTSELAEKEGWSFTDTLPDGLVVADPSNTGGTCEATTTATAGGDTITVTDGKLAMDEVSCTVTVDVTSDTPTGSQPSPKTYENCAANVTDRVGLLEPGCATVAFFSEPALTIAKTASVADAAAGDVVTYTITATNTGNGDYTVTNPATVTDDLTGVLDDAAYNDDAASDLEPQPSYAEPTLTWTGPLPVGDTVTITYSVTVDDPLSDDGDDLLHNIVTAPDSNCEDGTATDCFADVPIESLSVAKTADVNSAKPGDTVTYTVTVTNDGQVPLTGIEVTDDLTGVLDDATYNDDATATSGTVSYVEPTLTWTGDLAVDASAMITYSVTVDDPDDGDHLLSNAVTGPDGTNCETGSDDPDCRTVVPVTDLDIVKSADTATAAPGDTVTYTVTVTNTGEADYTGATVTDDLTGVLDDATYNDDASATSGTVSYAEPTLTWTGTVPVDGSVTITYSVTVNDPDEGDGVLENTVTGPGCPTGTDDPDCSTDVDVLSLDIDKQADLTVADPGDTVTYTLTVTNTGQVPYTGAEVTDDLTAVLDDAAYNDDATATSGTVSYSEPTLTWTGDIPADGSVTITYSVMVNDPDEGDHRLANAVTGPAGSNCGDDSTDPACSTEVPVRELDIVKTADTATADPGDTVTYTLTVTNTGAAPYIGAVVTDDLTEVIDDATYNDDATADSGTVSYAEPTLTWTGAIPVDGSVTITYSVTVDDPVEGDGVLTNAVVGPSCPEGSTDADCSIDVPIRSMEIVKEADAASAQPGDTVTYTVTVTNTGQVPYIGAVVTDDLTEVIDDATYNDDATADSGTVSYAEPTLTWTGAIPVDGSVTITYSVTVNDPDEGDHLLHNVVTGPDGSNCPQYTENCESVVPVGDLNVVKSADVATALPGDTVTFTITVSNDGQSDAGAVYADDLTEVLDDATYNDDAEASGGLVVYAEPTLSWAGVVPASESVTITYSVTVDDPVEGDHVLRNAVTGPDCPDDGSNLDCAAEVPVQSMSIVKSADPADVEPGGTVTYTVTVTNTGEVDYTAAEVADDLTAVLDDAVYNDDATATSGTVSYAEPTLTWTGDLPVGESATITYSVTVNDPDEGDGVLTNAVTGPDGSNCETGSTDPDCGTETPVQSIEVVKSADVESTMPGETVTYTVTITNTGQVDYTGAEYTDDLTDVLDDAAYNDDATADTGTVSYSEPVLTWTGDVPVDGSVTITYSVTVDDPLEGDGLLKNAVTGPGCPILPANPDCSTEVPVRAMSIAKTAEPTEVEPGGTVTYTVTVTNTGQVAYLAAEVSDDLSGVLDDAVYNDDASATGGSVSYAEPTLTWTGALPVGGSVIITYSVTVNDPAEGDDVLTNAITGPDGSNCETGSTDPDCTTDTPIRSIEVVKSADVGSTMPGETVTYTVTVTNTGQVDYTGIAYSDDLSGVIDDAVYNDDASATSGSVSYAEPTLTWTGDVPVDGSVTITYSVSVDDPIGGDGHLQNAVTGPGCPTTEQLDPDCTTDTPVQSIEVVKTVDTDEAAPGDTVRYTVTVTNLGQVALDAAVVSDDLSDVLDDAAYNDDATATGGSVAYDEPILTWTGDLPIGGSVTITYSVRVNDPTTGDEMLRNTVTGPPGSNCPDDAERCSTNVPVNVPVVPPTPAPPDDEIVQTGRSFLAIAATALALLILGTIAIAGVARRRST